jgi:hypothetical protein
MTPRPSAPRSRQREGGRKRLRAVAVDEKNSGGGDEPGAENG